jgi:hypothetical protein
MFEVFASICLFGAAMVQDCNDYVVESYDDQLTCEIVANGYRLDPLWIDPACIPSPAVEPMP